MNKNILKDFSIRQIWDCVMVPQNTEAWGVFTD